MEHDGLGRGYLDTIGSSDSVVYAPDSVSGGSTGKPDSDGFIAEVHYQPCMSTKLAMRYTFCDKFNSLSKIYRGAGGRAANDNTLYLRA